MYNSYSYCAFIPTGDATDRPTHRPIDRGSILVSHHSIYGDVLAVGVVVLGGKGGID